MTRMAMTLLLALAALPVAAQGASGRMLHEPPALNAPLAWYVGYRARHTLPDPTQFHVCRVLKRYGGKVCMSPPYAPLGKRCTCSGPDGKRLPGVVTWR